MPENNNSEFLENLSNTSDAFFEQAKVTLKDKDARSLDEKDLANKITNDVALFSKLAETVEHANLVGKNGTRKRRDVNEIKDAVALTVNVISPTEEVKRKLEEDLLFKLYAQSHNGSIDLPSWFTFMESLVNVEIDKEILPAPEKCARSIRNAPDDVKELLSECDQNRQKYDDYKNTPETDDDENKGEYGPSGTLTRKARAEWFKKQTDLANKILSLKVDPIDLTAYADYSNFFISLNAGTMKEMALHCKELGNLIVALTQEGLSDLIIPKIVLRLREDGAGLLAIERETIEPLASISKESLRASLPQILEAYVSLRQALTQTYKAFNKAGFSSVGQGVIEAKNEAEHVLASLFLNDDINTLNALAAAKDEGTVQTSLRKLMFANVIGGDTSAGQSLFVDNRKYTGILPEAMTAILEDDEEAVNQLKSRSGTFVPFIEFGLALREVMKLEKRDQLAEFLDEKLRRCTEKQQFNTVSYEERVALLVGIFIVSNMKDIQLLLKARLRNKGLISKLLEEMQGDVARIESGSSKFLGDLRKEIEQNFKPKMNDYWGKEKLKDSFRRKIERHLHLLEHPESWAGIPPKEVFKNGYLLYGPPGSGKGFLLECVSNEFGVPIEEVTQEERERSIAEAKKTKSRGGYSRDNSEEKIQLDTAYAQFLNERIENGREQMRSYGSVASFLFINEMESEFLNRNSSTVDQKQNRLTNVMLRVIERKIAENPEIIFVGATNYIGQVDLAAVRVGRYGDPNYVGPTNREDVIANLTGNFNRLGCDQKQLTNLSSYEDLIEACKNLTPLAIAQSVNNTICFLGEDRPEVMTNDVIQKIIHEVQDLKAGIEKIDEEIQKAKKLELDIL